MGQTPQGAADKKASERILASVRTVKVERFRRSSARLDWIAGVALLLGADPAWRCQFSDLANPPCTPGVLDTVRTGLRCKYNHFKM